MNNLEKQTFAKNALTEALLKLLNEKKLSHITISELSRESHVSRVSFYRNYQNFEAVLIEKIQSLLNNWYNENREKFEIDIQKTGRNDLQLASLFEHIKENQDFYCLLFQQDLLHLIIPPLASILSPQEHSDNFASYLESFYLYGLYGWIHDWINRGMIESADELESWLRMREIK
ncbi:TetR/AcrR family transcriptional regulator [Streptococcus pneumoniae]|nr:TetR/AcrR family transcriptional regulator [Streptococcus pneumoniae]